MVPVLLKSTHSLSVNNSVKFESEQSKFFNFGSTLQIEFITRFVFEVFCGKKHVYVGDLK